MIGAGYVFHYAVTDFASLMNTLGRFWEFQNALQKLVKEGSVEAKKISLPTGEQTYYRAKSS